MVDDPLKARILEILQGYAAVEDEEFTELVLRLHRAQRQASPFLDRYYSAAQAVKPRHWSEVVGLPTSAFKRTAVRAFPEQDTLGFFQTSGTTEGESGRHYFESLEFYEAAILPNFERHLLPAGERMPMLFLTPPPDDAPHSSLIHMMEVVRRQLSEGQSDLSGSSDYFFNSGALQFDRLLRRLKKNQQKGTPVFLLGTAFAFVYLLDALTDANESLVLSPGSRIVETGGFKGRTREVARDEFYSLLHTATGVPLHCIVNEYGMTELFSQFYDVSLSTGIPSTGKSIPPWTRILCIDPVTNKPAPDGVPGLIRIYDLANIGSCCVLQTEDLGTKFEETFEVHGRVAQAQPRGCSLAVEAFLPGNSVRLRN